MKNLIIVLFVFLGLSLKAQTVYSSFAGYGTVTNITGTGPSFDLTISSFVGNPRFEPNGQYFASDVTTGDVLWVNCTRLPITFVGVTSASSMVITVNAPGVDWALGISGPSINQRVAIVSEESGLPFLPQTGDGNSGTISGISSDLYTCMLNHYQKALLTTYNPVNEIVDYVGITNVAPATDPTLYTGQLWKNSVGQLYRSNGVSWINDGYTLNTSTEFAGNGTLATPLKLAQQSATTGQTLKWDGTKWTPANDNVGSVVTANLTGTSKVTVTNGVGAVLGASNVVLDVNEANLNSGLIPIIDIGNYFPNDNVNAALQVLGAASQPGVTKLGPTIAPSGPNGGLISNDTLYLAPADDIYKGVIRLAGDLDLPANAPVVTGFYGRDLVSTAPTDGQVYAWNSTLSRWVPTTPSAGGLTDLSIANRTANNLDVVSSTGTDATLPFATNLLAGLLTGGDKAKLDTLNNQSISAGTGISVLRTGQNYQVTNTGDLSNTNELQTISYSAPTITLSNGGGSFNIPQGTVTNVSATPSNGITTTINNPGTTPELVIGLGAITPTSVNASGTIAGSNLSGTNTGDNSPNSLYSGLVTNQPANLSVTGTASPLTLNSSDGTDVTISGGAGVGLVGTSSSIQIVNTLPENTTILDGTTIDLTQTGGQITAEIKQQGATSGQVLSWDGSNWSPSTPSSGVTDLSVSNRTTTTLDVLSNTGADATLPFATNLLAGLLVADDKTKLDNITVTSPVNLNTLATNSHVPVTITGETYITLAGQVLTANQINSTNIANGTILYADINQNGATNNQSFRWNGSAWVNYTTVTSLTATPSTVNVGLDFNAGAASGPVILAANASRAGVLTAALWSKLDTLNNQRVLAGTGIGVVKVGQDYTVTNNAPDQTVTITGATGTYPNFTLPTVDGSETKVNSGTNISVTGAGTIASPYVVNNSAPESTTVTDGTTINLTKTGNDITAELQQQSATTGQVLKWNGTAWIPQNDNVGSVTTNNLLGTDRIDVVNGTGAILGASPVTIDVIESGLNSSSILITDTGGYFTIDNINAALQQLGANNHAPLTVTDGTIIDFTLTGQNLTATILSGSITNTDLAASGATTNQVLAFNGTNWVPTTPSSGITDLSVANRTTTTLDVLSNTGTDATIPAATNLLAGLMISADKAKSDFITVTQAVDLDAIELSSHSPVTKTGASYLSLSGQALTANLIGAGDLSSMGAASDQVMKWNGATWIPTSLPTDSLYKVSTVSSFSNSAIYSKWETGRVVSTDGFYTSGDNGGANYIIEASGTVDNIVIFAVGSRRARLLPNTDGGVNFFQLGCIKNDAIADDERLQKGIDVFNNIYCFDNTAKFIFSKPLELKSNTKIQLGRSTTIEKNNDWAALMLWNDGENNSRAPDSNIVILGGIWDKQSPPGETYTFGTFNPSSYSGALVDYGFCFTNCKNLRVENLSVLNCSKYAMSLNEQVKPYIHNIYLDSYSDGIDFIGKSEDIVIDGVTGRTHDDFVGIFATAWTTNIIGTMGNINNVSISNIYPDDNTTSNTIVIGAGNNGGVPYTISNVNITNVSSSRTNNPTIKVAQYGVVGDPLTETLTGGVVNGMNISNITAGVGAAAIIEMGIDTIKNVNISNVLFKNSRPSAGIIINDGYLDNINISNYVAETTTNGLYIADSVNIKNISFSDCNITVNATNKSAFTIENDTCSFLIDNCVFRTNGTSDNAALLLKGKDNRYGISNTRFFNANQAINDFGARDTFLVSNVVFNTPIGIYSGSASSSTIIKASTYSHNSTDVPKKTFLRGSVNFPVLQTGNDENLFEVTTSISIYDIPIEMPIGTTYRITNSNTVPIVIALSGSEVFASGSNNFFLPSNATVTAKRFSNTLWRIVGSGTSENFLPTGVSGQTLSYDASNRIIANNQLENTSGSLKTNVRLTTQSGITANNMGENIIITSDGTTGNNGVLYGTVGGAFSLSNQAKTRELLNTSTGWNFIGNVGHGILAPLAPIHIKSSSNPNAIIEFDGFGTIASPGLPALKFKAGTFDGARIETDFRFNSGVNYTSLRFWVNNSSGTLQNKFTMNGQNGWFGIGVIDPTAALDVIGDVKSDSWVSAGNRLLFANSTGVANETSIDPAHVLVIGSAYGGDVFGTYDNLQLDTAVVETINIADDAITQDKIANDAVGSAQIANSAVGSSEIINGSVGALDLAAQSATVGQVLTYAGAGIGWTPATPSGGGGGGSLPTGTSTQTLRYDATNTIVATSQIQADTTVGIGGAAASDELTIYGTTKSIGSLKIEGTGLNSGVWVTNTTPITGITWYMLQDNSGFLYFQESAGNTVPLILRGNLVETTNTLVKDAIYKDITTVTGITTYQVTGLESLIKLTTGIDLTTINLPEIVASAPSFNQVTPGFILTLVVKSPNAVIINRAGADTFIQHAATGSYTSFPISANTVAILELIALEDNLWSIK
jgi:hypothetical protein